ncbi:MAG TPA: alpha/beta fold hydrolase [Tepidisphaeraceae bacterium]|nr:alpha/beta fold hydrolase [Tepidisphaeraceae bacterium]
MLPLVLHHGFMGLGNFQIGKFRMSYFSGGIERALAARGHPLIVPRVHPTAGIATRARQLKETILRQLDILGRPNDPVIVIGHSMGGLDARYMIANLGMAPRVRALVTIATPHHGTAYADWCLRHLGQRLGGLRLAQFLGLDMQAMIDLTTAGCRKFNEQTPDSPAVRYYSISGARPWNKVPPFALHSWQVVHDAEGDNDCLVSVKSSIWGKHLGVWPADHFHQINKRFVLELKDATGDITPYYLRVLDELNADGT